MRRLISLTLLMATGIAAVVFATGAADSGGYRVLAVFDNANQATVGEQVRVAGVPVGVIEDLDTTPDNKAAVTLRIDNPAYQDFRSDAHCIVRPQSLIGEQFVECTPTRPKPGGAAAAPPLEKVPAGYGKGDYLLPVSNTSSPVGLDMINNIMRVPQRQRFALILNEFGVALAGNGENLNEVIRRGYPALQETNKVLEILSGQNRLLASLAEKSDASVAPLARERKEISSFINSAQKVAAATAEKGQSVQQQWSLFPQFLNELTPTMVDLASFANASAGFLEPLQPQTSNINTIVANLPGFSGNSTNSVVSLGQSADTGKAVFTDAPTLASLTKFKQLAENLNPFANGLGGFLASIQKKGGWEYLMQTIYFQSAAINGYTESGHYGRGELVTYPLGQCATAFAYRSYYYGECKANFATAGSSASSASSAAKAVAARRAGWKARGANGADAGNSAGQNAGRPAGGNEAAGGEGTKAAKSAMLEYLIGGDGR